MQKQSNENYPRVHQYLLIVFSLLSLIISITGFIIGSIIGTWWSWLLGVLCLSNIFLVVATGCIYCSAEGNIDDEME